MSVIGDLFIGLAAALLFFLLEPYLLGLEQPWTSVSAAAVLIGAGAIAHLIRRSRPHSAERGRKILTGNKAGKGLKITAKDVDTTGGQGDVLSENKAKGDVKINISNSKF